MFTQLLSKSTSRLCVCVWGWMQHLFPYSEPVFIVLCAHLLIYLSQLDGGSCTAICINSAGNFLLKKHYELMVWIEDFTCCELIFKPKEGWNITNVINVMQLSLFYTVINMHRQWPVVMFLAECILLFQSRSPRTIFAVIVLCYIPLKMLWSIALLQEGRYPVQI